MRSLLMQSAPRSWLGIVTDVRRERRTSWTTVCSVSCLETGLAGGTTAVIAGSTCHRPGTAAGVGGSPGPAADVFSARVDGLVDATGDARRWQVGGVRGGEEGEEADGRGTHGLLRRELRLGVYVL